MTYTIRFMDNTEEIVESDNSPTIYMGFIIFGNDYMVQAMSVKEIFKGKKEKK